jgi:DNA-directed RNA polymerase III subunit RPC1
MKKVAEKCKKIRECPYCGASNGTVKKVTGAPALKIVHARYKGKHNEDGLDELLDSLQIAMDSNRELPVATYMSGNNVPFDDLLPTKGLELFKKIPDDDCEVMWLDPLIRRAENLILENPLVLPVPI